MKTSFVALAFTTLALSVTSVAVAQTPQTAINSATVRTIVAPVNPSTLVNLAYQGQLKDQNIPSYGALITAYQSGQIQATELVQGAVAQNRLPSQILTDNGYLSAVETQLRALSNSR